jgi:hypothetical protein
LFLTDRRFYLNRSEFAGIKTCPALDAKFLDDPVGLFLFTHNGLLRTAPQAGAASLAKLLYYMEGAEFAADPGLTPVISDM